MVLGCTPERIDEYLSDYGWEFERIDDSNWSTGWYSGQKEYQLNISLNQSVLDFVVSPITAIDFKWRNNAKLSKYLLEINHRLHIAKLSIDENGVLLMSAQILRSGVNYPRFETMLSIICYYVEKTEFEIYSFIENHPQSSSGGSSIYLS